MTTDLFLVLVIVIVLNKNGNVIENYDFEDHLELMNGSCQRRFML